MTITFVDRVKAFMNPRPTAPPPTKGWNDYYYAGLIGNNQDFSLTDAGYAQAAVAISAIYRGLMFWQTFIAGLTWEIKRGDDDEVIASSTDRQAGHIWHHALKRHRKQYKRGLLGLCVITDKLYGETYVQKLMNEWGYGAGYRWLNPLAMTVNEQHGQVAYFTYSAAGEYARLTDYEVAYRIYGFDPANDIAGTGNVRPIMSAANLDRNVKRHLTAFFRNGAMPGAMVAPKFQDGMSETWSDPEVRLIRQYMEEQHKGVDKAHGLAIFPKAADITTYPSQDIDKMYSLHEPLTREIMMAMEVPPTLAGDPSMTKYHDGDPVMQNWARLTGIPYARDLAGFINDDLLPFVDLEGDSYFEWDLSEFDVIGEQAEIESRVISQDLSAGIVSMGAAMRKRGYEPPEGYEDQFDKLFMMGDTPVPVEEIGNLWKYKILVAPSVFNAEEITGKPLPQPVDPTQVVPTGNPDNPDAIPLDENVPPSPATAPLPTQAVQADAIAELDTFRKFAHKHGVIKAQRFECHHIDGALALTIKARLRDEHPVSDIFDDMASVLSGDLPDDWQPEPDSPTALYADTISVLPCDETIKRAAVVRFQLGVLAAKAIQATRVDFEDAVEGLLSDAIAGDVSRRQFTPRLNVIIGENVRKAFIDGLKDGGVSNVSPSDITADDFEWLDNWLVEQRQFVKNLADAIYKDGVVTPQEAASKPAMWWNMSVMPAYHRGLLSAGADPALERTLGATEKHCRDCSALDGQVRRFSFWKERNLLDASPRTECGGFQCKCRNLPTDKPISKGRLPRLVGPR